MPETVSARRNRIVAGAALGALLLGAVPAAGAGEGSAVPDVSVRLDGERGFAASAGDEQQPAKETTFRVRVRNGGDATGSFVLDGERGGAAFAVRYLEGATGDDRITERVVEGTYVLEDVGVGETRRLRIVVRVRADAPIDRTGSWTLLASSPTADDEVAVEVRSVTSVYARGAGVTLRVPAATWLGIAFHESLFGQAAALRPVGRLQRNAHPAYDPPPNTAGPGYMVMDPRGRGTPPTSASDDVLPRGEPVLAPVTGRVIRVTPYRLYCRWDDVRVAIRPEDAPERTVQVFHLVAPSVERGDRVVVSHTVLGRARRFPFRSQVQDFGLPGRHVHLEVERDGSAPLPGCGRAMPANAWGWLDL